uniref:Uncharacterized protein n=1 Tax=Anguilla anguilla TaxID=7936 RepID=A0A0E9UDT1_ANGAN
MHVFSKKSVCFGQCVEALLLAKITLCFYLGTVIGSLF